MKDWNPDEENAYKQSEIIARGEPIGPSKLQRRLRIGYCLAIRIIERLEKEGLLHQGLTYKGEKEWR